MDIAGLIATYGPFAVMAGTAMEGDTAAIAGGLLAGHGLVPWWQVALAAAGGAYIADNLVFLAGRRMRGHRWVAALSRKKAMERAMRAVERAPILFMLGFRFMPGMRTVGALSVAATRVSGLEYRLLTIVSTGIWGATLTALGALFGRQLEHFWGHIAQVEHKLVLPALLVLAPLAVFVWHRLRRRRQARRTAAEAVESHADTP